MNFRTLSGVLLSAAIGAAGTFASTFVIGGLYLLYSRFADRHHAREWKALQDEHARTARALDLEASRAAADLEPSRVEEGAEVVPLAPRKTL